MKVHYQGKLDNKQGDVLIAWSEDAIEAMELPILQKKRAVRCAIEMIQNLVKHAGIGEFALHHRSSPLSIVMMSRNLLDVATHEHVSQSWQAAMAIPFSDLRAAIRTSLQEGKRTPGGGAGLGLLDLRVCTEDHLRAEFIPCDNGLNEFVLHATILSNDSHDPS